MMLIVKGNKVLLGDGTLISPGFVVISGAHITAVHAYLPTDLANADIIESEFVSPGFIDIHTHGIGGESELLEYWLHDFTFKKLPEYGCTSVVASVTYPKDYRVSQQVIDILKKRLHVVLDGQAVLAGIHSEGPIVSDCGGLPHSHASSMALDEFKAILQHLGDALKVMTISPSAEAKCGYARLRALLDHGAVPALGHDRNATEEDIIGALRVCAERSPPVFPHITHLFNVSSFNHRLPSLANFGMVDRLPNQSQFQGLSPPTVEIVGDMVHVAPITIANMLAARHPQHIAFVTDAVMDHGCPSITYNGNKMSVQNITDNKRAVVLHGTSTIAGSCTNMFEIFQSLVKILQVPVEQAVQMLSDTPSKITKINNNIGSIEVGKRADILLIDANLELCSTMIAGSIVYTRK